MDNDSLELSRRALLAGALAGAASLSAFPRAAFASETLTAAVLQFGTVHWLLDVITEHKLDEREGFALKLRMVATNSAGEVALLGQQADLIVADWFWVMRQRSLGGDFLFMPYSAAVGGVVIPKDSAIHSVGDLKGKRVGVAGGPLDKSWLLLRAYGVKEGVGDVGAVAQPVFGAPPLLNEQMLAGRVDALLNYWPFAVRLEAAGYKRLLTVAEMMRAFDIQSVLPLIGFVFPGSLAKDRPRLIRGFANAMQNAQQILLTSDAEWERIKPLMKAGSDEEFRALRERYREGLLHTWSDRDREAAGKLFNILAQLGGEEMTGPGVRFDPKAFWDGLVF